MDNIIKQAPDNFTNEEIENIYNKNNQDNYITLFKDNMHNRNQNLEVIILIIGF